MKRFIAYQHGHSGNTFNHVVFITTFVITHTVRSMGRLDPLVAPSFLPKTAARTPTPPETITLFSVGKPELRDEVLPLSKLYAATQGPRAQARLERTRVREQRRKKVSGSSSSSPQDPLELAITHGSSKISGEEQLIASSGSGSSLATLHPLSPNMHPSSSRLSGYDTDGDVEANSSDDNSAAAMSKVASIRSLVNVRGHSNHALSLAMGSAPSTESLDQLDAAPSTESLDQLDVSAFSNEGKGLQSPDTSPHPHSVQDPLERTFSELDLLAAVSDPQQDRSRQQATAVKGTATLSRQTLNEQAPPQSVSLRFWGRE